MGDEPLGSWVEWGVAARPFPGQVSSGDHHVVRAIPGGVLVAVLDVLGHGVEAAALARTAAAILEAHAAEPIAALLDHCHQHLLGTRGAALSLALFEEKAGTLTWLGVGNVDGVLLRGDTQTNPSPESLLVRAGVVGYQLPRLEASVAPIQRGDVLVVTTDGIRSGFAADLRLSQPPQQMADHILSRYAKATDDALALVVRYLGDRS